MALVGSMTHCAGYRACAVAHDRDLLTIGLDAEPHDKLPDGVLEAVSSEEERKRLAALAAAVPGTHWDRMLFSAKESVYKAWFPLTQRWLGFEDASVTIDPEQGAFTAQLLVNGPHINDLPLTGFTGRWLVDGGLVLTVVAVLA
jgi:4'-phosphopantetheinyl transferase EntD